jgi:beta-apo-4'-carotenal oxygenase
MVQKAKSVLKDKWFVTDSKSSPDLTRIVNANHFKRLTKLLAETKGTVVLGGESDSTDLFIEPTIVGKKETKTNRSS